MTLATVEQARAAILAVAAPLGIVETALADADGRWLAETVAATRDQPPFHASAMDGWAVRSVEAVPGSRLSIVGEIAAGHASGVTVGPGEAARIFTGAPLPPGADRVVIQEEARRDADALILGERISEATWVRPSGGDFRSGDVLLTPGTRLGPWRLALAAAAGRGQLLCAKRPRLAVLPTGDEVRAGGGALDDHAIHDSAGPAVAALARRWGADAWLMPPAKDDDASLRSFMAGTDVDVLVTIGGASVGDHDRLRPVARGLGVELVVDGIAMRPGKPLWFGRFATGRHVLGLPGNPVSALVCADLFLAPLLAALQGGRAEPVVEQAVLGAPLEANGAREHYMRARRSWVAGSATVFPAAAQDSSLVGVLAASDCLIRRAPHAPALVTGESVELVSLPSER